MGQQPPSGSAMPTYQANLPLGSMAGIGGGGQGHNNFGTINNQFINVSNNQ